jgi:hypothetical protein
MWLYGGTLYFWHISRVSYRGVLEFYDQRDQPSLDYSDVFEACSSLTLVYISTLTVYTIALGWGDWNYFPPYIMHQALSAFIVLIIFCPLDFFYRSTRCYLLVTFWNSLLCAFRPLRPFQMKRSPSWSVLDVRFDEFFCAAQWCSLIRITIDYVYAACFYFTGSFLTNDADQCAAAASSASWILTLLPFVLIFCQMVNAYLFCNPAFKSFWFWNSAKIGFGVITTLLNLFASAVPTTAWKLVWILFAVTSSMWGFYWDVVFDWGISVDLENRVRRLPRRSVSVYYIAIVLNLLLRICWIATISPAILGIGGAISPFFAMILAALEIVRKSIWNIFHVEKIFLKNCDEFRPTVIRVHNVQTVFATVPGEAQGETPGENPASTQMTDQPPHTVAALPRRVSCAILLPRPMSLDDTTLANDCVPGSPDSITWAQLQARVDSCNNTLVFNTAGDMATASARSVRLDQAAISSDDHKRSSAADFDSKQPWGSG